VYLIHNDKHLLKKKQVVYLNDQGLSKVFFLLKVARKRAVFERDDGVCVALEAPHKHHHLSREASAVGASRQWKSDF
jgi:hypothetical protein